MSKKVFYIIPNNEKEQLVELNSKTPREAALKAATRKIDMIYLVEHEGCKLHVFRGEKKELSEEEQNEFTRSNKIFTKPVATKMAYKRLDRCVNVKKEIDMNYVKSVIETLNE